MHGQIIHARRALGGARGLYCSNIERKLEPLAVRNVRAVEHGAGLALVIYYADELFARIGGIAVYAVYPAAEYISSAAGQLQYKFRIALARAEFNLRAAYAELPAPKLLHNRIRRGLHPPYKPRRGRAAARRVHKHAVVMLRYKLWQY